MSRQDHVVKPVPSPHWRNESKFRSRWKSVLDIGMFGLTYMVHESLGQMDRKLGSEAGFKVMVITLQRGQDHITHHINSKTKEVALLYHDT